MTTLPAKRIIESRFKDANVSEEESQTIQDAICDGMQINCYTDGKLRNSAQEKETCLTRFVDPSAGAVRFAVEAWHGSQKWTYDFADKNHALDYQRGELDKLGI